MTSVRIRPAKSHDVEAITALEADCLGRDAWSEGLVREGVEGRLPTIHYLVAEDDEVVVAHAVASIVADIGELQRIAVTTAVAADGRGVDAARARGRTGPPRWCDSGAPRGP